MGRCRWVEVVSSCNSIVSSFGSEKDWERKRGKLRTSGGFRGGRAPLGPDPIPYSPRHFAMKAHIPVTLSVGIISFGT